MIFLTASLTLAIDLAPVQTIFPELNINADVFGSLIRMTRPGNCSGLYSVFGNASANLINGISFSREADATIFWILISFFGLLGIYNPPDLGIAYFFEVLGVYKGIYKDFKNEQPPRLTKRAYSYK